MFLALLFLGCSAISAGPEPVLDTDIHVNFFINETSYYQVGSGISFDVEMKFGKDAKDVKFFVCGQTTPDSNLVRPIRMEIRTETEVDSIIIDSNAIFLSAENLKGFEEGAIATIV